MTDFVEENEASLSTPQSAGERAQTLGTAELISLNERLRLELEERSRVEEVLRISQARFAGILEIADDAIISVDKAQRIILFNQGAEKIFGYAAAEVMGQPLDVLLPLRYVQAHRHHVVEFAKSSNQARKMTHRPEIFGRRKNGTEFPAEASISRLHLGEEQVFTVILRDITKRKQAESELERLIRQNQLILNAVGEGLCGLDTEGKITFVNPAAVKLLGYQMEELIGQSIHIILPHAKSDGTPYPLTASPIYASLRDGGVHQVTDEVFRRNNGTSFPVEYVSTPIIEQGALVGAVVTFKDITDRQLVERMKDEFISVVSHELRTPLTSIHGSLGMLASGLLSAESERGKRLLEIAVDSTERLVRLINDILDIERIESGKVTMTKQACDAANLISQAADVMQAMAERYGVTLSVSTDFASSQWSVVPCQLSVVTSYKQRTTDDGRRTTDNVQVWADSDRIIQTLTNLLSNAIKFSSGGNTVWLSAQRQEDQIVFQVKDRGRGIPADKLDTIFERFQQVDASDSRNQEGTGLGLAICRSIVQQHGGRIWVESVLGEGSTFYFNLPILKQEKLSRHTLSGPLVLVCDDDPSIRTLLQTLLEQQNYRVVTVASGQEAVDQAAALRPDAILLDMLMPGMNGWEVMAILKEQADTKDIPIIICSVTSPDESHLPDGNFVDWLDKPLDQLSLLGSLKQALAKPSKRVRVLVVEDDSNLAQLLISMFERHEIETFHAQTGREAIRLSQQLNPDLLILDLVLPDTDGFAVVEWLQQHNYLHNLPLVVYSAKDLKDSERNQLRLGQTEFLSKGRVTVQEFEHRVMELLQGMTHNRHKDGSDDSQTNFGD